MMDRMTVLVCMTFFLIFLWTGAQLLPIFYNVYPKWACLPNDTAYENFTALLVEPGLLTRDCQVLDRCQASGGRLVMEDAVFGSAIVEWRMQCGSALYYMATVMPTLQFAGLMVGTVFWGHVGDKIGRRPTGIIVTTISAIAGVLSGLARGWMSLSMCRFAYGFSMAGLITVTFTHCIELCRADQRMMLRCWFNWGWSRFILTFVCFVCQDWRSATIIISLIYTIPMLLLLVFLIPESPHWLETKNRTVELRKARAWIHRINGTKDVQPDAKELESLRTTSNGVVKLCDDDDDNDGAAAATVGSGGQTYTLRYLFSSRELTKRTCVYMAMWFTTALSSFANDLNSSQLYGDFYGNQFLISLAIGFSKIALYFVDKYVPQFRRRTLHQLPLSLVIILFSAILIVQYINLPYAGITITVLNVIATMFIECTWDADYISCAEGYPTVVRAIGVGTCSFMARVGAVVAPQLAYLSLMWPPAVFLVILLVCIATLALSVWGMPETKGLKLPEFDVAEAVPEDKLE